MQHRLPDWLYRSVGHSYAKAYSDYHEEWPQTLRERFGRLLNPPQDYQTLMAEAWTALEYKKDDREFFERFFGEIHATVQGVKFRQKLDVKWIRRGCLYPVFNAFRTAHRRLERHFTEDECHEYAPSQYAWVLEHFLDDHRLRGFRETLAYFCQKAEQFSTAEYLNATFSDDFYMRLAAQSPDQPNADRNYFIRVMSCFFEEKLGDPKHCVVANLTSTIFLDRDLDIDYVRRLSSRARSLITASQAPTQKPSKGKSPRRSR